MRKKNIKILLAGLLGAALTLPMGQALPAMAAATGGTPDSPAEACFSKTLMVPAGVDDPASGSFAFQWSKAELDGNTSDAGLLPDLPAISLDPLAGDASPETVGGSLAYSVSSPNIVAGVTFPQPGIYTYGLKEAQGYSGSLPSTDSIKYSAAEYKVMVQVALAGDGSTYVENIVVDQAKGDGGSPGDGKTAPDPDGSTPEANPFTFTNGYVRTGGGTTPGGQEGVLELSKRIANKWTGAAPGGVATSFPFGIAVTKAASEVGDPTYHYETFDSDGTSTGAGTIAFAAGAATATASITLKEGEYAVFKDFPVGTAYTVTENGGTVLPNYNTSYEVTDPDGTATTVPGMATGSRTIADSTGAYGVACTNRYYSTEVPTGIVMDSLPFLGLIAVALSGAAAFVIARRRRARDASGS